MSNARHSSIGFLRRCGLIALLSSLPTSFLDAQTLESLPGSSVTSSIAIYDELLSKTESDADLINLGDMHIPASTVRAWRDKLAAAQLGLAVTSPDGLTIAPPGGVTPNAATPATLVKWPGGIVYYAFAAGVTPEHQRAYKDAAAEWSTFANVRFAPRTNQTNYSYVQNASISGGQSAVGMTGGAQTFLIGANGWNRGTLLHEMGHTLGLIHEHQRFDRDSYVSILTANISGGPSNGNFTLIPDSLGAGAYDFYSIMHYLRNAFSIDPDNLNTIVPKAAYSSFLNVYGQQYDRPLSKRDRDGLAAIYGAGPTLSSVVTNTQDSGPGSLRAALYYAFDNPGTTITFNIPATDPGFTGTVYVIKPTAGLFAAGNNTTINGSSQPGNTNAAGPEIVLSGVYVQPPETYTPGLKLIGANCTVRGLTIQGFSQEGILITGSAATGNKVAGCYIGLNSNGSAAVSNAYAGITLEAGAHGNTIGGTLASDRNVISGNSTQGIYLADAGTTGNVISGNYIGTKYSGASAVPNGYSGVGIFGGASGNTIGGTTSAARNIICGNQAQGIAIADPATSGNIVAGNFIGVNANGRTTIPNAWSGISIFDGAAGNLIGGTTAASRNVISGNGAQGITLSGAGTSSNTISANYIGLSSTGTVAVGNAYAGIQIYDGAANNLIGGDGTSGTRNFISGNSAQGVAISDPGTSGNFVVGNFIGTNSAGTAALPNAYGGVDIFDGATANVIGGPSAYARNVISGNSSRGVGIFGAGTNSNYVGGNYVGLKSDGRGLVPNNGSGIAIFSGAKNNLIGVTANRGTSGTSVARNYVCGNVNQGITLSGTGTTGNSITSNFIGLNATGDAGFGNGWSGVDVFSGASGNFIGKLNGRNYIGSNGNYGISLSGAGTTGNSVSSNYVGLNATAVIRGNIWSGIVLFGGATANRIGSGVSSEANTIAGNSLRGIDIFDAATTGNSIKGNAIYNNGGIGINLVGGTEIGSSVTANDATDSDTGPNNLQNYPVLTGAKSSSGTLLSGTLKSVPSQTYRLEFFSNTAADPSGYGEGQKFLFYKNFSTDAAGNLNFSFLYSVSLAPGTILSTTAIAANGDTSEFSKNITVTSGP